VPKPAGSGPARNANDDGVHDDADSLVALGARVRSRRRQLGLTLRELSRRSGLSAPFLSQVENGVGTPSLTSLFGLARVLGTAPEWLLAGPTHDDVALVRRVDGPHYPVTDSDRSAERRQITGTDEPFSAAEYIVAPGADLGGFHSSQGRELLHVLTGRLAVDLRDVDDVTTHELAAGDTLLYSTTVEHRWRHRGRGDTRFLHVVSPGP
jgi:transcriptional regulator with XRE-family HTH domain